MKYIALDFEFNQYYEDGNGQPILKLPFEIIQIGAIKLDENLNKIAIFNKFIKPEGYIKIHPFIEELTGITTEKLSNENNFKLVYDEFLRFLNNEASIFCLWGMMDIKELFRNVNYHQLNPDLLPLSYIDLQSYASKIFKCPRGTKIGLRHATEWLRIPLSGPFHDAFYDAYYTAEIFKRLYHEELKPKEYDFNFSSIKRVQPKKSRLNQDKLIQQFEKMYSRKMTEEEQDIIRLAYLMGHTNQFQV